MLKKRKLLSILLVLSLLCSLCAPTALAVEPTEKQIKIVIDLRTYTGAVSGQFKISGNTYEIKAGERNEYIVNEKFQTEGGGGVTSIVTSTVTLDNFSPSGYKGWTVSGTASNGELNQYLHDHEDTGKYVLSYSNKEEKTFITIQGNKLSFKMTSMSRILNSDYGLGGGSTIILAPAPAESTHSATVSVAQEGRGTAEALKGTVADQYVLAAMGAEDYAFDYWLAEGSSDRIYDNPYTVNLTKNTNFTAYFRDRRVLTVENAGHGTASFSYVNSSNGADQYTLTATPDELYMFDYWSWEGVPTGAENSAPEEQALPDEDMPRKSLRQPSLPRTGRRMPPGRKRLHPPRWLCCA